MRRVSGIGFILALALFLTGCGGDSTSTTPTATTVPTKAASATATQMPASSATATIIPAASPVGATPVGIDNTVLATPMAESGTPTSASPVAEAVAPSTTDSFQTLTGTVLLTGTANERFVIGNDGCVGLGEFVGLQAGQQVIIRDQTGGILGAANLAATSSAVVCSWTFTVEVPNSDWYLVSIPLRAEKAFSAADVIASNGQVELTLP